MVSDAVTFIMQKHGAKIFAYIDDYVGIADALLIRLGLPINQQKLSPPSKTLTCLGVHINIPDASLSIDQEKLMAIHKECFHVANKKYLSKKNFQSLLVKLIYIHKCVLPARIFINRMLELFRNNSHKKKIYLSTSFFSGSGMVQEVFAPLQWYYHL